MPECSNPRFSQLHEIDLEGATPGIHDERSVADQLSIVLARKLAEQALGSVPHHCLAEPTSDDHTHAGAGFGDSARDEAEQRGIPPAALALDTFYLFRPPQEQQTVSAHTARSQVALTQSIDVAPWRDASRGLFSHPWCSFACETRDPFCASNSTGASTSWTWLGSPSLMARKLVDYKGRPARSQSEGAAGGVLI